MKEKNNNSEARKCIFHKTHDGHLYSQSPQIVGEQQFSLAERSQAIILSPVQTPAANNCCASSRGQPSLKEHSLRTQGYARVRRRKLSNPYVRKHSPREEETNHLRYYCTAIQRYKESIKTSPLQNQHITTLVDGEKWVNSVSTIYRKQRILSTPDRSHHQAAPWSSLPSSSSLHGVP